MFKQTNRQRTDQVREAAEILISNNSADYTSTPQTPARYPNNLPVSLHDSVRHNEEYLHETLASGSSRDGKISAVRRFFCLFVTFDLLFTSLLWIICVIVVYVAKFIFSFLKILIFVFIFNRYPYCLIKQ